MQFGDLLVSTVTITDTDLVLADDGSNRSLVIFPLGEPELDGAVGQEFTELGFEVQDANSDNVPVAGVSVTWSASPEGSAVFPDGNTTVTDENGMTRNRVVITGNGFVRIVGTANSEITPQSVQAKAEEAQNAHPVLNQRNIPPPFEVAANQAFYTIRVGLGAREGLTLNQARIGTALDLACEEI